MCALQRTKPRDYRDELPENAEIVQPVRVKPKPTPPTFKLRPVEVGWPVTYYRDSDVHLGAGDRGFVVKVEGETISLLVMSLEGLRRFNSVRHIDDPKCQSPNLKRWGAWDYADTREWRTIKELLRDAEVAKTRIEALEAKVAAILGENPEEVAAANEAAYASAAADDSDPTEPEADGELVAGAIEETDDNDPSP